MENMDIFQSIGFTVGGLLLFYFSFIQHKKLKNKNYKPNKKAAKEWPYIDNMEEISDYSDKVFHLRIMVCSAIVIVIGIVNLYFELKNLIE